jgi:hypothetical protein
MMIKLKSGREVYANQGIFGLSPELDLSEGYDGHPSYDLSKEDKLEIAEMMIARWYAFKHEIIMEDI